MYLYDPTITQSLSYQHTLNLAASTAAINDVAVYNEDDSHIYMAIATENNVQIYLWKGTVTPSGAFYAKGILNTTSTTTVNTLCWWVDETNPLYAAYLATVMWAIMSIFMVYHKPIHLTLSVPLTLDQVHLLLCCGM